MTNAAAYRERAVFAAACAGMLLFGMAMLSLGTVNSYLAARFALDQVGVGSLAALLPFGILAGSLVFGPIVDRFGYKVPLVISAVLLSGAMEMMVLSETFPPVQGAFFVIGFAGGILNGGTNALVADISGENRGARLSLLGVFFGLGALGMPLLTGLLLQSFSYDAILNGFVVAIALPVLFFLFIRFPVPKQTQGFPLGAGAQLVRNPALLLLSAILFFESGAEGLVNNWSPSFFAKVHGIPADQALFLLTVLAASLTVTRLVLGGVLRRVGSGPILAGAVASAVLGTGVLLIGTGSISGTVAMVLIGVGFSAAFPVILGQIGDLFPALSGTAFGIALVIALSGNTLINYVLGLLAEQWGLSVFPWYLLGDLGCLGFFLLLGEARYHTHIHQQG
jgi:FHS family glucose/mannose:H+ symporter-like MFS transporter